MNVYKTNFRIMLHQVVLFVLTLIGPFTQNLVRPLINGRSIGLSPLVSPFVVLSLSSVTYAHSRMHNRRTLNDVINDLKEEHGQLQESSKWPKILLDELENGTWKMEDLLLAEEPFINIKRKNKGNVRHYDQMPQINLHNVLAVKSNILKVLNEGKCSLPVQKCIKVDVGPGIELWPRCALLHRCGHDTGCCPHPDKVCSPVAEENVHLYFYSTDIKKSRMRVEVMEFVNHTHCQCTELRIPDQHHFVDFPFQDNPLPPSSYMSQEGQMQQQRRNKKCRCPKHFTPLIDETLTCQCECEDKQTKCFKIMSGRRRLNSIDTKCIFLKNCETPPCLYGSYTHQEGRCPRKPRTHSKRRTNLKGNGGTKRGNG